MAEQSTDWGTDLNSLQGKAVNIHTESYKATGTVVAEFYTLAGKPRLVVEFDSPVNGLLHIFNYGNVTLREGIKNG